MSTNPSFLCRCLLLGELLRDEARCDDLPSIRRARRHETAIDIATGELTGKQ